MTEGLFCGGAGVGGSGVCMGWCVVRFVFVGALSWSPVDHLAFGQGASGGRFSVFSGGGLVGGVCSAGEVGPLFSFLGHGTCFMFLNRAQTRVFL